ncbi:MAG: ABC transporter permease [Deltaproteobacteria bacterium]|nr:ABC transporter permease [Deltaproteobacteria bacterium]
MKLAVRRFRHEYLFSLCSIFSLAAFLVPLLTLMGIKDGIIGTLTRRLIENPRNLELSPRGTGSFPDSFFIELRKHPAAGFVIAETRTLSATMSLLKPGQEALRVDLAATDEGDPIILAAVPKPDFSAGFEEKTVFLSRSAADRLQVKAGDSLSGRIGRLAGGVEETALLEMTVGGILPEELVGRYYLFCRLSLLKKIEDFRSGFEVPSLGWPGRAKPEAEILYPRFRVYARDLDGVEVLKQHLASLDLEVQSRSEEIALVRRLDHSFTVVFLALLAVVAFGAFASVSSGAVDQVAKMRRSLAVLALLGLSRGKLAVFTLSQSLITGFLAAAVSEGLFWVIARALNFYFGGSFGLGEKVCSLTPEKLALAGAAVLVFMLLASLAAVTGLFDLEPSEGMRDV